MRRVRRLRRIFWNVATAASLLLCAALVALWVRSYWVSDEVRWEWQVMWDFGAGRFPTTQYRSVCARRGRVFYT
jgi:hypothetical protein